MGKNRLTYILAGVVIILSLLLYKSCNNAGEYKELVKYLSATLDTTRNELGQQNASISVLQLSREKDFLMLATQDSTIQWLKKTVKNYKGKLDMALVIGNTTTTKGKTVTIIERDTIENEIFSTYTTSWNTEWENGWITAGKDSISREIKFRNKYEVTFGKVKNGWFKKKEYEVNVLNLNPKTYTTELRSFSVKEQPKRINIGIQVGYGLGLLDFKIQPYVGIGIQYNLIGVK